MSETTETGTIELPWEDCLLERKLEGGLKDLVKTLVAFANSIKPGHTAVLLIGQEARSAGLEGPQADQRG